MTAKRLRDLLKGADDADLIVIVLPEELMPAGKFDLALDTDERVKVICSVGCIGEENKRLQKKQQEG